MLPDKNKYISYSTEELTDDLNFASWVLYKSNNEFFTELINQYPDFSTRARKAQKIILLLRVHDETISAELKIGIWQKIKQIQTAQSTRISLQSYHKLIKIAAIVVFALIISGLGYYEAVKYNDHSTYAFTKLGNINNSKLILSTGEEIDLRSNESLIQVNGKNKAIKINHRNIVPITDGAGTEQAEVKMNEVIVPYGKKSIIELADGTKVWLNAGSRIAFPSGFKGTKREVFLDGEAYFEVFHNKSMPFLVKTNDLTVKVLGTKFNISAYETDKDVMTVLVEGKVTLSDNSGFRLLKKETVMLPNQRVIFNKSHKTMTLKNEPDVAYYTAWTLGWFTFSKESLADVFKRLERYYNVKFIENSSFHSDDLLSGKLDLKTSIEEVMKALSDVAKIDYKIENNKVYIVKKRG
ncbi:MAG: DUF4974 domain-containing protein [Bacteroidota bacterium]|nr:DUF4974 domain-containing protein [Bacteroidota bacterium]